MFQRILRHLGIRNADTALLLIGFLLAAIFFGVFAILAVDAKLLPGLTRAGNLNFDVDVGELIFGVLGGGAAVWAAKTFASRGGPDGSGPEGAKSGPRSPDFGDHDESDNVDELLYEMRYQLRVIRARLDALIESRQKR